MANESEQPKLEEVDSLIRAKLNSLKNRLRGEFLHEYQRWEELCGWLNIIDNEVKIGAYCVRGGGPRLGSKNAILLWADHKAISVNHIRFNLPSDCSPGELIYQILRHLSQADFDIQDVANIPEDRKQSISLARLGGVDLFPYPKDVSERRALLERASEYSVRRYDRLLVDRILLDDAENLTPKGLKELIYLNKRLRCSFFLLGNGELPDLISRGRNNSIDVYREGGESLNEGLNPQFTLLLKQYYLVRQIYRDNKLEMRQAMVNKKESDGEQEELEIYPSF